MNQQRILAAGLIAALVSVAAAVGVEDGTYRTLKGDRAPEDITRNIRIVPPPTGGDLQVRIRADKARYHVGDRIKLTFGVNRDSYVYIFNTDAAGMTNQIFPNYYDRSNFLRAGKTYYIPDRTYDLEVTPPRGTNRVTIVAVAQDYPFLAEYRAYTRRDPYPASREGATALIRRIESFRSEPSGMSIQPVRPAPREQMWATDDTTFYVMDIPGREPPDYRVARYGALAINTYPTNARIYLDGDYFGRSPQIISRLEIGYHKLRVEKEGYLPYECNVYVKGNETKDLDIFLHETPAEPGFRRSAKPEDGWWGFFDPVR
ncbi:MAG: DUF4384 domain-containing protein [Candidatus Sumerlaeaceae bacterium]|nr:DUF4384 domain-containing protein [Candidatus Sumerlaeaceae bacterium]